MYFYVGYDEASYEKVMLNHQDLVSNPNASKEAKNSGKGKTLS